MKIIIALAFLPLLFSACDSANNQHPTTQYEEKKTSLKEMETDSPLKFLKVTGDFHGNLLNQTVVTGKITNNATLVSYKDIQLIAIFKNNEGTVIEKQKQLLNEVVPPNSTTTFKVKISHVKEANTVSVDIVGATANK